MVELVPHSCTSLYICGRRPPMVESMPHSCISLYVYAWRTCVYAHAAHACFAHPFACLHMRVCTSALPSQSLLHFASRFFLFISLRTFRAHFPVVSVLSSEYFFDVSLSHPTFNQFLRESTLSPGLCAVCGSGGKSPPRAGSWEGDGRARPPPEPALRGGPSGPFHAPIPSPSSPP